MSIILPLPKAWHEELCFECKFLFERGEARFVPAVAIEVSEPLFEGSTGVAIAPLCAHHAEVAEVDGVLPPDTPSWLLEEAT